MIVLDARVLVDLVVGAPRASRISRQLRDDGEWCVPEHFTVEVLGALRGLHLAVHLSGAGLAEAAGRVASVGVTVAPSRPLLPRIVELAPSLSAYDAAYVALAEALDVPLITTDLRLTRATGPRCRFIAVT